MQGDNFDRFKHVKNKNIKKTGLLFRLFHFLFLFLGHFWQRSYENTKILLHIFKSFFTFCKARWARQKKKPEKNHATKVTKIPKTKRQKYGM